MCIFEYKQMKTRQIDPEKLKIGDSVLAYDQDEASWNKVMVVGINENDQVTFRESDSASEGFDFEWESPFDEIRSINFFKNI